MRKSAQQKFNEYLNEAAETRFAVNEMVKQSHKRYGDYSYAAGYLESLIMELVGELPKARRAAIRDRLLANAEDQIKVMLMQTIKESDNA